MKSKVIKKALYILASSSLTLCMYGCGSSSEPEEDTEVEYDEDGNPIEKEENSTLLLEDSKSMITGLVATMEEGSITTNGVWLTEQEVGEIAERYSAGAYTYEKGRFKKNQVKYVLNFYDIDGGRVSSMYLDDDMEMCYEGEYLIFDSVMRGLFSDAVEKIKPDSVLEMDQVTNKNTTTGNGMEQPSSNTDVSSNTTVELSTQAFAQVDGIDNATAEILAQSTFNLGIPVVKKASLEANVISFTDINDVEYTLSVVDGRITAIYNETAQEYVYSLQ